MSARGRKKAGEPRVQRTIEKYNAVLQAGPGGAGQDCLHGLSARPASSSARLGEHEFPGEATEINTPATRAFGEMHSRVEPAEGALVLTL
jgi:hypothetical protein